MKDPAAVSDIIEELKRLYPEAACSLPFWSSARPSRSASAASFWACALASARACSMPSSTARILVMASSDILSPLFHQLPEE